MRHHHHRRGIESGDEDPDFVVERQAVGTNDPPHASLLYPGFGGRKQGIEHGLIIDRLKKPEVTRFVMKNCEMSMVDLGTDAANRSFPAPRQPKTSVSMFEEW